MLTRVAQIVTAAHRDLQSCAYRPTNKPDRTPKLLQSGLLHGWELPTEKKWGWKRYFKTCWVAQSIRCCFYWFTINLPWWKTYGHHPHTKLHLHAKSKLWVFCGSSSFSSTAAQNSKTFEVLSRTYPVFKHFQGPWISKNRIQALSRMNPHHHSHQLHPHQEPVLRHGRNRRHKEPIRACRKSCHDILQTAPSRS